MTHSNLWKALGPGILVACAAVGGSHLVWSTRAGAQFGWSLLGLVLIANLLKFPFFLYGQRYTAATGESILAGYKRHGTGFVWIFLLTNILTGTVTIAGVSMLSGALLAGYGITALSIQVLTVCILAVCALFLLLGNYSLLDSFAKIIIVVLTVGTLAAVAVAIPNASEPVADFVSLSPWTWASFAFLISLLGWMPAPVDLSAWSSLWMFSRQEQTGHFATTRETSIDFYIGYISVVVLAVVFLAFGALTMFGSGKTFSNSGIAFSHQLITLYTTTIGEWSHFLILTAAFVTMFSTTLTCLDGYPRSLAACCSLIWDLPQKRFQEIHRGWLIISVLAAAAIVLLFVSNLIQLLTYAAVVCFITSPIIAFINYKVMNGPNVPAKERPGIVLKLISWCGLIFLVAMTAAYAYLKLVIED